MPRHISQRTVERPAGEQPVGGVVHIQCHAAARSEAGIVADRHLRQPRNLNHAQRPGIERALVQPPVECARVGRGGGYAPENQIRGLLETCREIRASARRTVDKK